MRAFIIDDHALVRMGLRMLLAKTERFAEIVEFETLTDAIGSASPCPDLVVLDLGLPDADELEAVLAVRRHMAAARLLVVAGTEDGELIARAFAHGIAGFVPKNSAGSTVAAAVSSVLAGQLYVPPHVLPSFKRRGPARTAPTTTPADIKLTARQTDVLRGMVAGLQNKDIAQRLGTSPATVRAHVSAILLALGVKTRTQAAMHPFAKTLPAIDQE